MEAPTGRCVFCGEPIKSEEYVYRMVVYSKGQFYHKVCPEKEVKPNHGYIWS